jgi:hypothetical protein
MKQPDSSEFINKQLELHKEVEKKGSIFPIDVEEIKREVRKEIRRKAKKSKEKKQVWFWQNNEDVKALIVIAISIIGIVWMVGLK